VNHTQAFQGRTSLYPNAIDPQEFLAGLKRGLQEEIDGYDGLRVDGRGKSLLVS